MSNVRKQHWYVIEPRYSSNEFSFDNPRGRYDTKEEAEEAALKLRAQGFEIKVVVVQDGDVRPSLPYQGIARRKLNDSERRD